MNENELTTWFVFTVIPIVLAVAGFVWKLSKDKKDNENRITHIEATVDNSKTNIKEIQDEQRQQREDIKIMLQIDSKIDTLTNRFDNFEDRFYNNN